MNASRLRIPRVDAAGYMNRVVLAQHAQAKDSGTGAIRSSASPTTRAGISSRERFRDAHSGGAQPRTRDRESFGGLDIEVVGEVEHVEGHAAFEHAGFQPKIEIPATARGAPQRRAPRRARPAAPHRAGAALAPNAERSFSARSPPAASNAVSLRANATAEHLQGCCSRSKDAKDTLC